MDTPTLVVIFNMTAALIFAGIVVYLIRSGKWPKKSDSEQQDTPDQS